MPGVVAHVFNPSNQEAKVGVWVQGQPDLHSKFWDGRDYTERPCLRQTSNKSPDPTAPLCDVTEEVEALREDLRKEPWPGVPQRA